MAVKGKVRAAVLRKAKGLVRRRKTMDNYYDDGNTPLYTTVFQNDADIPWRVTEKGNDLFFVEPHDSLKLESWKATTDWARWSKVVRGKDLRLTLTENPQWSNPWEGKFHCLELVNQDGAVEETIQVVAPNPASGRAEGYVSVVRDVPRIIPLNIWDPLARYSKIIWHRVPTKVKIEGTKYFRTKKRVVKECVPRSKADLRNVLRERRKIEEEKLREKQKLAEQEHNVLMVEQEKVLMGEQT